MTEISFPITEESKYSLISLEPYKGRFNTKARIKDKEQDKLFTHFYNRLNLSKQVKKHTEETKDNRGNKILTILSSDYQEVNEELLNQIGIKGFEFENELSIVDTEDNDLSDTKYVSCTKISDKVVYTGGMIIKNGLNNPGFEIIEAVDSGNSLKLTIPLETKQYLDIDLTLQYGYSIYGLTSNILKALVDTSGNITFKLNTIEDIIIEKKDNKECVILVELNNGKVFLQINEEEKIDIGMTVLYDPDHLKTRVSLSSTEAILNLGYEFNATDVEAQSNISRYEISEETKERLSALNKHLDYFIVEPKEEDETVTVVSHTRKAKDIPFTKVFAVCDEKDIAKTIVDMAYPLSSNKNIFVVTQEDNFNYKLLYNGLGRVLATTADNTDIRFVVDFKEGLCLLNYGMDTEVEDIPESLNENYKPFFINEIKEYEKPIVVVLEINEKSTLEPTTVISKVLENNELIPISEVTKPDATVYKHLVIENDKSQVVYNGINNPIRVKPFLTRNLNINEQNNIEVPNVLKGGTRNFSYQVPLKLGEKITLENVINETKNNSDVFLITANVKEMNKASSVSYLDDIIEYSKQNVLFSVDTNGVNTKPIVKLDKEISNKTISISYSNERVITITVDDNEHSFDVKDLEHFDDVIYITHSVISNNNSMNTLFNNTTFYKENI